jgi:hypothetical protein
MLKGNISEFSLPELFKMMGEGEKTGLLCLTYNSSFSANGFNSIPTNNYYIWFKQGEIVAASNRLDGRGLISLMSRRSWIDQDKLSSQLASLKSVKVPLGSFLKSQQLIKDQELEMLFKMQVSRQIMPLFEIKEAPFKFYENVSAPLTELTGLSINTQELMLRSLRALRDWSILQNKLPTRESTLVNTFEGNSSFCLDEWEKRIWELAPHNFTLHEIARKLNLHITKVQQAAFRLICIGFVEEVPIVVASSQPIEIKTPSEKQGSIDNQSLSQTYLNKLVSFLRNQESFSSVVAA